MERQMPTSASPQTGFSLVEVMVGMVISLLATIVIFQIFAISEGQKRTTTSGSDAQQNGLQSLFMIEREVRMAGTGLAEMGCTVINAFDASRPSGSQAFSISGLPVLITQNDPTTGFDSLTVLYSSSSTAAVPTTIKTAMPNESAILNATYASQVKQTNILILSEPGKPCSRIQATQDGQKTGQDWNVQHNSGTSNYNPDGGHIGVLFPSGGYGAGAQLWTYGNMVNRRYYVQNNNLMMQDLNTGTTSILVSGIVALRAQYGRDTNGDSIANVYDNTALTTNTEAVAIRIAVVARSAQYEKTTVSPASLKLWPDSASAPTTTGPTLALDTTAQHYRYKVYQTIVPLRNVIWNE